MQSFLRYLVFCSGFISRSIHNQYVLTCFSSPLDKGIWYSFFHPPLFCGIDRNWDWLWGKSIWGKRFSKIWNRPPRTIVGRGFLTPHLPPFNLMKDPLYCLCLHPFLQILSNPLSLSMSLPTSTPTVPYVVLFLWLNG